MNDHRIAGSGGHDQEAASPMEVHAPVILLAVFSGVVLAAMVAVPRGEPPGRESDVGAKAHGPAEFPDILDVNPLEGLEASSADYPVPPPPFSKGIYPCSKCHEPVSGEEEIRELKESYQALPRLDEIAPEDIDPDLPLHVQSVRIVLQHGPRERWCFDCHNPNDRDTLRLANGNPVKFTESYLLCAQCHGTIFRDWKAGVHGRRSGFWNGKKRLLLCAHCHDPHSPRFKPKKPLPPPVSPAHLVQEKDR
ncbi:MAG: hypothetical protein HY720_08715 [Planctomycetes bacterium]|nr:hypothetical protein [Planctomycetota bacterium]